ncbi:uncharacterized protein LOC126901133 [Daktulosphaira vitifoliae]|uniref:uncharacterized protein LOC126901133 n=1 Tax=Daktulosphaira vitifoliae TaxID=58002 RepID=UPI0021AAA00E|nr:uncharacterized protein LOC126901133 [Daktulosphaira vitifoliae]
MKSLYVLLVFLLLQYDVICITKDTSSIVKPALTEENLNWAAFTENYNDGSNINNNVRSKFDQTPIASSIHQQKTQTLNSNQNLGEPSWDGENCPPKTTGLYPIILDCRKYLNCFKGRGFVQSCAPGTLFNSKSLECDFPSKVQCFNGNLPNSITQPNQNFQTNEQLPNQEYYVGNHDQLKNNRNQVDGSSIVENTYHDSSNILNDYGVQPEKSKPLYGSDFIVNGPIRNQESTRQFKNPDLSSNQNIQSVTKEQNKFSDKPVTTQQFNNNPIENSNYYNPNIPSNYPSSSNQYNSNFDKHTRINQPQNKVRFSKEFSNLSQNKYNTLNKENNNPTLVSPTSWMRNQLKGKHGSNQNINSYSQTNVPLGNQVFEGQISEPVSDYNLNTNSQQINSNSRYPSNFDGSHSYTNYNRQTPIENVPVINTGYPNSENTPLFALEQSQNPPLISHNIELNSNNKPDTDYKQPTSSQYPHSILYNKPINSNVFQNNEQLAGYPITYNSQTNSKPVDDRSNNQFQILIPNITESEQFLSPHFTSLKDTYNDRSANGRKYSNQNVDQPYVYDNAYTSRPEISTYPLQNKVSDIKCPNNYNGILPHPYDCSKFLSCANGRTFIMDCGPGTLFNPTISVCDHPYNVQCNRVIEIAATTEIYNPDLDLDVRANFSEDISNSDVVSQTELPDNRAVLETLPIENRQLKVLRNPTSIDLSDNHLPNTSIIHTPFKDVIKKVENNISVRIDLKPNSTQSIRLRGGPKHSEGFLQVQEKPFQWGVVCDEPNLWTIDKADIVCRQLGFKRGAEQTWQGLTVTTDNPTKLLRNIGVTKVSCNGQESVFHNCQLQNDKSCNVERDAVWIKCRTNSGSRCQPEEVSYEDKCYKLYIPTVDKQNKSIQDIGFSKVEALEHCQKRGGSLIDINSQKENDFVSEWLYRQQIDGPILTSGVGVSVLGNPIWIWEGTENPFVHRNWWPGWEFKKTSSPNIKSNRALCIVLHKSFPCPSNPNSTKLCDSEYYYWEAIDCGTKTDRLPYICERNIDDIGCINGAGSDYNGAANTTASGNKCLSWEDATVLAAMKYRVSEKTRKILLTKHNKCRNPDGTDLQPWCYVQSTVGMVRSEFCDIPTCSTAAKSFRASALNQQIKCDVGYFECQPNECINQAWVCDNQADCSNGIDEKNCTNPLDNFSKTPEVRLPSNEIEKWLHTTVHTCANRCIMSEGFVCRSFSHSEVDQTCILSDGLKNDSLFLEPHKEWTYYEANNADCFGKFICDNGNCIDKVQECDGHNDCGDRSDENKCNGTDKKMGYEIRLAGGNTTYEGRVEVKVLGEWGMICDDKFDVREADVVCRELGFPSSLAVKSNSYFGVPVNKTRFVLDDLECRGNEKSLYSCQFKEWGIHDCNAQESVGVICRVPGGKNCTNEEFECQSGECIPIRFLCDSYADCTDKSDEHPDRCNSPLEVRLVGGNERRAGLEGRVEVRQYGIWGTVCDDDFGTKEALVICNHLGYKGSADFKKDAAFGPGKGQIWLDQLRCIGNETSLEHCIHAKWGQHNCKHDEDVSVICHLDRKQKNDTVILPKYEIITNKKLLKEYLPTQCGKKIVSLEKSKIQMRIASGFTSERGVHPWQASIRSKTPSGQMAHVCGAVIISEYHVMTAAHCVRDLDKDVYYVRIGDYDMDFQEDSEQDIYIDEIYNHENFEEGSIKLNNDIAVIKLKTNGIKFNKYVQPVCLPSKDIKVKDDFNCSITGWGSDGSIGSSFAKILRWAIVPIIDSKICKADYVYGKLSISNGMFCAGNLDGGADACQGDSGGPLVCKTDYGETVVGITSWGYGCGRANHPGVYTNVSYYRTWLDKTLLYSMTFE